ncbi:MAG: hypothetical protein M3P08_09430 [Thermoproteota archaeon]|nr:hypothetical protein [Thermoproteota archaeon]
MTAENSNPNSNSNREVLCLELSNKPSQENIVEDFMLNDNGYFVIKLDMEETKVYENVAGLFHLGSRYYYFQSALYQYLCFLV